LAFVFERRFFVLRENVYDVPGRRLRSGDDSGDIGILTDGAIGCNVIRFALLALLGLETLLFLPGSFLLALEKRLTTTIGQ
ncbi:MAG TPA: hypothetical protein VJH87_21290, partial [Vicinamibacteria bacterium]|nr:hypothetical protein [Vicinamibacteria bacterium]